MLLCAPRTPLAPSDVPDPEPGPGELRIRVAACGVQVVPYPLGRANEALADLREGRLRGAAVLVP